MQDSITRSLDVAKALDILVEANFFTYTAASTIAAVMEPGYQSENKSELVRGINAYNLAVSQIIKHINSEKE